MRTGMLGTAAAPCEGWPPLDSCSHRLGGDPGGGGSRAVANHSRELESLAGPGKLPSCVMGG